MNHCSISRRAFCAAGLAGLAGCASQGLASVAGRRVEVVRRGSGSPAIVLEAGLGFGASDWGQAPEQLLPRLAAISSVFAYSRPGYGNSEGTNASRDPVTIARELRQLLAVSNAAPPFVLVGHSLGGLYAQVFAALHPADTAGLVLIDPTHPRQWIEMKARAARDATLVSMLSITFAPTMRREFEASKEEPGVLATRYLGPVALLAARRPDPVASAAFVQMRQELMADLAERYRTSVQLVDAGHFIHREQPALVAEAVRRVVADARRP